MVAGILRSSNIFRHWICGANGKGSHIPSPSCQDSDDPMYSAPSVDNTWNHATFEALCKHDEYPKRAGVRCSRLSSITPCHYLTCASLRYRSPS